MSAPYNSSKAIRRWIVFYHGPTIGERLSLPDSNDTYELAVIVVAEQIC